MKLRDGEDSVVFDLHLFYFSYKGFKQFHLGPSTSVCFLFCPSKLEIVNLLR